MPTEYKVVSGDTLSSIAREHSLPSWRTIYDDPANASFRAKRPNPDRIFPGDIVMIPGTDPPSPPILPNLVPAAPSATPQAIKNYLLREMRRDVVSALIGQPANLVIFGETHFEDDSLKAHFLSEIIRRLSLRRPTLTQFHGSEHFSDDDVTRALIHTFLQASPQQTAQSHLIFQLPNKGGNLLTYLPVLALAQVFSNHRYAILGIDPVAIRGEDPRHTAIFNSFINSALRCPDVPPGSINAGASQGNLLLGEFHAAHRHEAGTGRGPTTCALLMDAGWKIHAVRLTVPFSVSNHPERMDMRPLSSSDGNPIDVLRIVESVAGGKPFYADLTKSDSPFSALKTQRQTRDEADIAYNKLFDAIVHLAATTVPFPV